MATAQEILARIKENKRKENEKLFRVVDNSNSCDIYTLPPTATGDSIYRLSTVGFSYQQEYQLYLNLAVYYLKHPSIIPPLHPYQKMLRKIAPRVYNTLYGNGTTYGMVAIDAPLLYYCVGLPIESYNNITNTLLAAIKFPVLRDIRVALSNLRGGEIQ